MNLKKDKLNEEIEKTSTLITEKLRTYQGFENVSEERAIEDIKSIKIFARILYDIYQKENKH